MSELPQDWVTTRLDNVAIVQGGYAFKSEDFQSTGTPVLRISNIAGLNDGLDNSCARINPAKLAGLERFRLSKGDIVVAMSGATTGKFGVFNLNETVFLNQRVGRINTKNAATLDQRYLFHYFGLLQKRILDAAYGAAQPNISPKEIAEFEIPLPPLPEQRRIVARIEELFSRLAAGIAVLRHAKAQLKRYRQSVLAAAVTGQLTQEWREQHPETESAGETVAAMLKERKEKWERKGKYSTAASPSGNLHPLPEKWCWATWDQLSHWVTYGFTRPMDHVEEGIPIVTAKHVKNSRINYDEGHRTPHKAYDNLSEKDRPQPGDILVTKDGTIGRAAIVESDTPFCINQSVAVVWLRTCPMYRKYLLTTIETEAAQRQMTEKARGVAIKHLSITDFARMNVPIPPLAEQHQIVAEVEARTTAIDHLEAELDRQITRSNRLRQSTLVHAFSGLV